MFTAIPSPQEIAQWDNEAIQLGISSAMLMENASREAFHVMQEYYGNLANVRVLLFMGGGNNGGDAAALGRHLHDAGACVLVVHTHPLDGYSGMAHEHIMLAQHCGVAFMPSEQWLEHTQDSQPPFITIDEQGHYRFTSPHALVDGLLGTGFQGPLRDSMRTIIQRLIDWKASQLVNTIPPSYCQPFDAFSASFPPLQHEFLLPPANSTLRCDMSLPDMITQNDSVLPDAKLFSYDEPVHDVRARKTPSYGASTYEMPAYNAPTPGVLSYEIPVVHRKPSLAEVSMRREDASLFANQLSNDTTYRRAGELLQRTTFFALDIPSGINGLTGKPSPIALQADVTITFEAPKLGLLLEHSRDYVGRLIVRPIGIPACVRKKYPTRVRMLVHPSKALPKTAYIAHKGQAGHVLVVGGSSGLMGAPHLAARAALRSGAGLVTLAAPAKALFEGCPTPPDCMTFALGSSNEWDVDALEVLCARITNYDAIVLGSGMGRTQKAALAVRTLLEHPHRPPIILDADALFALSSGLIPLDLITKTDMLTPHPGEVAVLLGCSTAEVQNDRFAALDALCQKVTAQVIIKGACTLTGSRNQPTILAPYVEPCLAIAGSGDVLAGLAGSLVAQGISPAMVAPLCVILHATAGKIVAKSYPCRGNTASTIAEALPMALSYIAKGDTVCLQQKIL